MEGRCWEFEAMETQACGVNCGSFSLGCQGKKDCVSWSKELGQAQAFPFCCSYFCLNKTGLAG
jgi:hypothetical protein